MFRRESNPEEPIGIELKAWISIGIELYNLFPAIFSIYPASSLLPHITSIPDLLLQLLFEPFKFRVRYHFITNSQTEAAKTTAYTFERMLTYMKEHIFTMQLLFSTLDARMLMSRYDGMCIRILEEFWGVYAIQIKADCTLSLSYYRELKDFSGKLEEILGEEIVAHSWRSPLSHINVYYIYM